MSLGRLRDWARGLKRDLRTIGLAARDPRVPLLAKVVALAVTAYALSPIDLIPDFIPVLGLLDDVLIVPAGLWLALRLIPAPLVAELRAKAETAGRLPPSRLGAVLVVLVWLAGGAALWSWLVEA